MPATLELDSEVLPPAERRGPGRPSLQIESLPVILDALIEGNTEETAARLAGIHPKTLSRWKGESEDFAEELARATAQYLAGVRRRIMGCKTNSGSNDPKAIELEVRRFPEFQQKQVSDSGVTINGPVIINVVSADQLRELQAVRLASLAEGRRRMEESAK